MGELIGIDELKDMVMAALDKGGSEAVALMITKPGVPAVIQDGVQMWWKHEVERKLSMS